MKDIIKQVRTKDIKIGDRVILCTGNYLLMEHAHGVIIETEGSYPDFEKDGRTIKLNHKVTEADLFVNKVVISLGLVSRLEFIDRVRPSGFSSQSCSTTLTQLEIEKEQFIEMFSSEIGCDSINHYNIEGGVTIANDDGALFDLSDLPVVKKNTVEVVKRLGLPSEIIRDMINNKNKGLEFFNQINKEMESLGCKGYTFKRPDGTSSLHRNPFSDILELRAYGLKGE
jgi:hypothetical protein